MLQSEYRGTPIVKQETKEIIPKPLQTQTRVGNPRRSDKVNQHNEKHYIIK